jgi:hypothetical protein
MIMNVRRVTAHLLLSLIGVPILAGLRPSHAAQDHRQHVATPLQREATDDKSQAAALVRVVRDATERFRDLAVAQAEGYELLFGCVSGPDSGAMGLHFVNLPLVMDPALDPARPEIVIYEPLANGRVRLIGADYLVFAKDWHVTHGPLDTPQLMGQLLHLFESPNRFGLDTFYTLHVWAWKENPTGTFVNWHSKVSCDAFSGETH